MFETGVLFQLFLFPYSGNKFDNTLPLPAVPVDQGHALPGDGYEPGPGLIEKILSIFAPPVDAAQRIFTAAECQSEYFIQYTEAGKINCTWFVAGKRPDVCQWVTQGQGHAYQWVAGANQNGGLMGVTVSKKPAKKGEIVVWDNTGCAGALGYGHVAILTGISSDGKMIDIEESNWDVGDGKRTIEVESCMSFISSPSTPVTAAPSTKIVTPMPQTKSTAEPSMLDNAKNWWCENIKLFCSSSW